MVWQVQVQKWVQSVGASVLANAGTAGKFGKKNCFNIWIFTIASSFKSSYSLRYTNQNVSWDPSKFLKFCSTFKNAIKLP